MATTTRLQHKVWRNGDYLISTDPSLIPITRLNEIFASDEAYWAKALPEDVLRETLENSLCFGLYNISGNANATESNKDDSQPLNQATHEFVGFARCVTDFTTFLYLTDVYVEPKLQGEGLGTWMIKCVQEVIDSMPYLRRSLAFTSNWKRSVPFYEKLMKLEVMECIKPKDGQEGKGMAVLVRNGKGHPDYVGES